MTLAFLFRDLGVFIIEVPSFMMIFVAVLGVNLESERSCFGVSKNSLTWESTEEAFVNSVRGGCERIKSLSKLPEPVVLLSGRNHPTYCIIILDGAEKNEDFLVVCLWRKSYCMVSWFHIKNPAAIVATAMFSSNVKTIKCFDLTEATKPRYIHSMNCIYMHVKQCTGNIQWWDDCQRHMKSKLRHGVIWIYGWIVYIFHYCDSEDLFVGRQSFPLLEGTVPFLKFSIFFFLRCDFAGSPGKNLR